MRVIPEARCIEEAEYLVAHNATIEEVSRFFGVSTSTVYANVTRHLYQIDTILAKKVETVLSYNKQQRAKRGGNAFAKKMQEQKEH